jgi:hypothetical protein
MSDADDLRARIRRAQEDLNASVDGHIWSPAQDEAINLAIKQTFETPAGQKTLDYLKAITTSTVAHPSTSSNQLWMLEGMRRLVGIIDTRRRK